MNYYEFSSVEAQIFGRNPKYWEIKHPHVPKNLHEIAEEMLKHMSPAERKEAITVAKAIITMSRYNVEYCEKFLEVAEMQHA